MLTLSEATRRWIASWRGLARATNRAVVVLLLGYQRVLSPLMSAMGSQCRFEPSCSQYMIDAVRARGAAVGIGLGLWRLARCNPLNAGGYDPAPGLGDRRVALDRYDGHARHAAGTHKRDVSRETA